MIRRELRSVIVSGIVSGICGFIGGFIGSFIGGDIGGVIGGVIGIGIGTGVIDSAIGSVIGVIDSGVQMRTWFTPRSPLAKSAPGGWLLKMADNVFSKATRNSVHQMVADMRVEQFEALKDGRKFRAWWMPYLHGFHIARALTLDRLIGAVINYVLGAFRAGK